MSVKLDDLPAPPPSPAPTQGGDSLSFIKRLGADYSVNDAKADNAPHPSKNLAKLDDLPAPPKEPGFLESGSKSEAFARGAANMATYGLGKYPSAVVNSALDTLTGYGHFSLDDIKNRIKSENEANANSKDKQESSYTMGEAAVLMPQLARGVVAGIAKMGAAAAEGTSTELAGGAATAGQKAAQVGTKIYEKVRNMPNTVPEAVEGAVKSVGKTLTGGSGPFRAVVDAAANAVEKSTGKVISPAIRRAVSIYAAGHVLSGASLSAKSFAKHLEDIL